MGSGKLQKEIDIQTAKVGEVVNETGKDIRKATRKKVGDATELRGPSPNIATNLAIADIALRGGAVLARRAVEHALLGQRYAPTKAKAILRGRTLTETAVQGVLARVALSSIPGAIVVVGGLAAKTLYDRSRDRRAARREGEGTLDDMAKKGRK